MTSMRGEKIYEIDLDIVGVTDYGLSLQADGGCRLCVGERAADLGRGDRERGHRKNSHRRVHAMSA